MTTFSRFFRIVTWSIVLSMGWAGSAFACGVMDSFFDIDVETRDNGQVITAIMANIEVTAEAGDTCFIATDLPSILDISEVRFDGPNGGEFDTFFEDPAVAAEFGPGYRAFSAVARVPVDLASFTLEIDVRSLSASIGLPRYSVAWADSTIAAGQTDGAGKIFGHASIVNLRKVEIRLPEP